MAIHNLGVVWRVSRAAHAPASAEPGSFDRGSIERRAIATARAAPEESPTPGQPLEAAHLAAIP
jgi:hypothetical protein